MEPNVVTTIVAGIVSAIIYVTGALLFVSALQVQSYFDSSYKVERDGKYLAYTLGISGLVTGIIGAFVPPILFGIVGTIYTGATLVFNVAAAMCVALAFIIYATDRDMPLIFAIPDMRQIPHTIYGYVMAAVLWVRSIPTNVKKDYEELKENG